MAEQAVVDEGVKLLSDIEAHALRLQKNAPKTVEGLTSEMAGTVLEFVKDVLTQHMQLRDWVVQGMGVLDERVADVEGEMGSRIIPDDADKLMSLIEGTKLLVARNLEVQLAPDVKRGLEELLKLAEECEEIVEDAMVDDDEPEDGETNGEGETEPAEGGAADGASPSS